MIAWSEDDERLREGIGLWCGKFAADSPRHDGETALARGQWLAVRESGLLRLPFDEKWGGLGRSLPTTMYALEELGRRCADSALNSAITTHMVSTGIALQRFGSTALKDTYLPRISAGTAIGTHAVTEPGSGSDALGMRTTATADGDCYRLSGAKAFVANGPVADLVVVYARTEPVAGPLGLTAFLVERDTPGLTFGGPTEETGPQCSLLSLDDCRVPRTHILGRVGAGFLVLDHVLTWEILCCSIVGAGETRRRIDRCTEYAGERVAHRIVDMETGLETSRKWLYDTAGRFAAGRRVTADLATAKLRSAETHYHRIAATLGLGRAA